MNTDVRVRKKPFELQVLAVKGNQCPADTSQKGWTSGQPNRLRYSVYEPMPAGPGEVGADGSSVTGQQSRGLQGGTDFQSLMPLRGAWGAKLQHLQKPVRRLLLSISGQTGAGVISAAVLWSALFLCNYSGWWVLEAVLGLAIVRLIYNLTRGPVSPLATYRIRKRMRWVLADEIQISVAFVAVCYLMAWQIDYFGMATFVLANLAAQIGLLYGSRLVIRWLAGRTHSMDEKAFAKRAVILGTGSHAQRVADMVLESPDLDTKLIGFLDYHKTGMWRYRDIPLIGHPERMGEVISSGQVDAVFVAIEPEDVGNSRALFDTAEKMGVCVFVMPNVYYPTVSKIRPSYVNGMPALIYHSVPEDRAGLFMKNLMDKVGALVALILALPIMLVTSLAIKLESRGPVLFMQARTGVNGRSFKLCKFRTMCVDAERKKEALEKKNEMTGPVFKIRNDPRVTTVGRVLRKFSIDELPQLVNVLKGDMSLVGPRPPLPTEVSNYEPWQHRKLSVKPGVTCLWQVNGRNTIDFDDWMRLDLEYIDNWSIWLDTKILLKTIPAVLKGSGV